MRWVRVWIILFPFLPAAAALYICLPFFFPLSLSVSFLSFFYFFLCICSRRLYPTTLDYARKIGNPGPHYSTVFNFFFFFYLSPFSRVRLASEPFCSGLSSPSISFWSNRLSAILTKWRSRFFLRNAYPRIVYETELYPRTATKFLDGRARRWIIKITPFYDSPKTIYETRNKINCKFRQSCLSTRS